MSVVCVCSRCNILISGKITIEMPISVASGTHDIIAHGLGSQEVEILRTAGTCCFRNFITLKVMLSV